MKDKHGRTFVPETPDHPPAASSGRSKRRSTLLSSVATNSLINQQHSKFESPACGLQSKEMTVVEETPDPGSQSAKKAEPSKSKSSRKARPLPSLLPSEITFVQQSQDIFSSTMNPEPTPSKPVPPPGGGGGSSSRRKKGKPFKIVQWDQVSDPVTAINETVHDASINLLESSLTTSDNNKPNEKETGEKSILGVQGEGTYQSPTSVKPQDDVAKAPKDADKSAEDLRREESRRLLEAADEAEEVPEENRSKMRKNRRISNAKSRRLSSAASRDFVQYILNKEKTPSPSMKAEPVKADTSSSDSDDDWEVVRSEDGSIKKYLPKSNRKSIVISGNLKSKTKKHLSGEADISRRQPPKSRKNLGKDLAKGSGGGSDPPAAPVPTGTVHDRGRANSTVLYGGRRSGRMSLVSQLSDVPEVSSEANTPPDDLSSSRNKTGSGSSRSGTSNAAPTATSAAAESSGHTSISVSGAGYSGLSFQNFSSDSAKEVLNKLGKEGWNSDLERRLADQPRRGRTRRSDTSALGSRNQAANNSANNDAKLNSISLPIDGGNSTSEDKNKTSGLANRKTGSSAANDIIPSSSPANRTASKKRKLSIEQSERRDKRSKLAGPVVGQEFVEPTPQRAKPVFSRVMIQDNKTSLTPQPMELSCLSPTQQPEESPARRSGRKTTQISTLASDGLLKSPTIAKAADGAQNRQIHPKTVETKKPPTENVQQPEKISPSVGCPIVGESPSRRSGRKSTQLCTLASDSLSKSPSLAATKLQPNIPGKSNPAAPAGAPNEADGNELPPTQAPPVFEGLVFFVELRSGRDNRTGACQKRLRQFGGVVEEKICKKVTHIVFQGATKANYLKAMKLNVPIVNVCWVEESISQGRLLPTAQYPFIDKDDYAKGKFPSLRKLKSMTIRTADEALARGEEKRKRKEKRLAKIKAKELERKKELERRKPIYYEPLHYEGSPYIEKNKKEKDDPLGRIINELKSPSGSPLNKEYFKAPDTPIWEDEEELNLSLADRLIHRYKKNKALAQGSTPSTPGANTSKDAELPETPLASSHSSGSDSLQATAVEATVTAAAGLSGVTESSSLDTTTKPRRRLKMVDKTMQDSPVLRASALCGARDQSADDASFVFKRRSGRASTQLSTKASAVLEMQENSPVKAVLAAKDVPAKSPKNNILTQSPTAPEGPQSSLSSTAGRKTITEKRGRPKKPKNIEVELENAEKHGFGSPSLESTRLSCLNQSSATARAPPSSSTAKQTKGRKEQQQQQQEAGDRKKPGKTTTGKTTSSTTTLDRNENHNKASSAVLDSTRKNTEVEFSSKVGVTTTTTTPLDKTAASALKSPAEAENDRLFDALLQSTFKGRRSTGKKFVLANSSLRSKGVRTPESRSPQLSPQRTVSSPRHLSSTSPRPHSQHSSSARQWMSLAAPSNQARSPQRGVTPSVGSSSYRNISTASLSSFSSQGKLQQASHNKATSNTQRSGTATVSPGPLGASSHEVNRPMLASGQPAGQLRIDTASISQPKGQASRQDLVKGESSRSQQAGQSRRDQQAVQSSSSLHSSLSSSSKQAGHSSSNLLTVQSSSSHQAGQPSRSQLAKGQSDKPTETSAGTTTTTSPPAELKSPRSRVVAPWRNQTGVANVSGASLDESCDIYEFDGFPDDPQPAGPANSASSPAKKKQIRVSSKPTKFGLPGDHKMFLVAPKRRNEGGGAINANSPTKAQNSTRTESPSSRHVNSTMKPQAKSPARQPDQEDISQLSPIISKQKRRGVQPSHSDRPSQQTFSERPAGIDRLQEAADALEAGQASRAGEEPRSPEPSPPPPEPRKVEKKRVLSKIFQKPKEQESSASSSGLDKSRANSRITRRSTSREESSNPSSSSSSKERTTAKKDKGDKSKEPRTARKHKLFSQNMLEETARESPGATTGPTTYDEVYKSKPSKSSSQSTFKVPKKKRKRAADTESDDGSVPSETDSQSSNQSDSEKGRIQSKVSKRLPRRSSMDFAPMPRFIQKMEARKNNSTESSSSSTSKSRRRGVGSSKNIVCTSCSQDDISLVNQLIKSYDRFSFSTTVNSRTTHVVSGEGKRTLNLLKGLLQGCWIVTKEWALASLEAGRWVDEEPYEMVDFSPAVKNLRIERSTWGASFKSELFNEIGTIYISPDCRAPRDELRQLVKAGGGLVSHQARIAQVVVGEEHPDPSVHAVTEKWILDSVQFNVIMPFSDYPI